MTLPVTPVKKTGALVKKDSSRNSGKSGPDFEGEVRRTRFFGHGFVEISISKGNLDMWQDERGKGPGTDDGKKHAPRADDVATFRSAVIGPLAPGQRWAVTTKREVVVSGPPL